MRTLKIMFEVYNKGLQNEIQLESQTLDKVTDKLSSVSLTY